MSRSGIAGVVGVAVCGVLIAGVVSPVWAAESSGPGGMPPVVELGSFGVGDGLEAVVNEADGSFGVVVPVGGLSLSWDSRVSGDRYGFGTGWGFGFAVVDVQGGVRVSPSSGGVFDAAESVPSGLSGYTGGDVVFRQVPDGVLVARTDGVVGERAYAFELHELGGMVTYFNAEGDPVASITAGGDRTDWGWAESASHRLDALVSVNGVVTELDWSDPGEVLVRPGVNVPADDGGAGVWRVRRDGGRVSAASDPVGGRSVVGYDRSGRVDRVLSGSGAVSTVLWRTDEDRVSRVDRIRVADPDGAEVSARKWRQLDGVLPTGWPITDPAATGTAGAAGEGRSVEVSDGKTRVVSSFDGWSRLTGKQVIVSTTAGEYVIQEQELTYPDGDPVGVGGPAGKPVASEVRFRDAAGGVRAGTEAYAYDELGRMLRRESADGTVLEREYDPETPEGRRLPVGLPVLERSTATDGSVTTTDTVLDGTRTIPIVVEQAMQAPGAIRVVTGRTEYTAEAGVVVEQRAFPGGDAESEPVVTRWDERLDLDQGVRTVTETVAAGTDLEVSTSAVASVLHGGTLTATDVLGNVSSASYDEAGRPVEARDPAGRVMTTTYQSPAIDGVDAVTVTGPDGVAVTEVRDVLGRVVQKQDNLNDDGAPVEGEVRVFERHEFPDPGVEETTDAWGATTRVEQDVHGRTTRVVRPNGLVQVTEYDDVTATVTTGVTPTGRLADAAQVAISRMDVSGRVTDTGGVRADEAPVPATSTVFDGFGREVEATDGTIRTTVDFDAAGHPATTTIGPADPAGAVDPVVAQRRFDGFGTSLEKTMAVGGQERSGGSREVDVLGRTVLETDQAGETIRYEYTPDGLHARLTTSAGQDFSYAYDPVSRAVTESRVATVDQVVATGYVYDETNGRPLAVFDPADRARTEITYTSDGHGNIRTVQYPGEQDGQPGAKVAHEYDRHGRKIATIDVAGNRSTFAYAKDGFLTGVAHMDVAGKELARVEYTPDEYGRIQQLTRGNGVTTTYEFTSADEIKSETTTAADGTVHSAREYEYDPATGNLVARVDRALDEASRDLTGERREYAYDLLDRLTASTVRDGADPDSPVSRTVEYEITVSGQVGKETTTAGEPGETTVREFAYASVGALDRITTTLPDGTTLVDAQVYDGPGNLTLSADGTAFEWDAANRQTGHVHPDGTRIETTYWADGTRKARTTSTGSTTFYWDDTTLINDVHTTVVDEHAGVASYLIGASRHARITASGAAPAAAVETQYYTTDRHGNVTDLMDQVGETTGTYAYSDYGIATPSQGTTGPVAGLVGAIGQLGYNPFQYSLEYTHADGTQFLRERTYDPGQFSFTSKDREALHDQYGYVNANPIMLIDPTGRLSFMDKLALGLNGIGIAGSLVGAAVAFAGVLSGGGFGLMLLGVFVGTYCVADAAFTVYETVSMLTDTRFMSEEVALAVGVGFAVTGIALGAVAGSRAVSRMASPRDVARTAPITAAPPITPDNARVLRGSPFQPGTPFGPPIDSVPASPLKRAEILESAKATHNHYLQPMPLEGMFAAALDIVGTRAPMDVLRAAWTRTTGLWQHVKDIGDPLRKRIGERLAAITSELHGNAIEKGFYNIAAEKGIANLTRKELATEVGAVNRRIDILMSELRSIEAYATRFPSDAGKNFAQAMKVTRGLAKEVLRKY